MTDLERVRASFQRCSDDIEFIDHFYLRFMESSAEVTQRFAGIDKNRQAVMLRGSLELMLGGAYHDNPAVALEKMAVMHGEQGLGIASHLYDLWLESLLASVKACDQHSDDTLLDSWRRVLEPGVQVMKQASHQSRV